MHQRFLTASVSPGCAQKQLFPSCAPIQPLEIRELKELDNGNRMKREMLGLSNKSNSSQAVDSQRCQSKSEPWMILCAFCPRISQYTTHAQHESSPLPLRKDYYSHLTRDGQSDAQRDQVAFPRSQSELVAEPCFEPRSLEILPIWLQVDHIAPA